MNNKTSKILLLTSAAVGLITLFQNCGPNNALREDDSITSLMTDPPVQEPENLDSRYTKATPVYFEFQMVQSAEQPPAGDPYMNYDLVAVAALSNGTDASLPYEISVVDKDNVVICPTRTGILASTFTRTLETCAKKKTSVIAKATMKIKTPDGVWHEYVQNYAE